MTNLTHLLRLVVVAGVLAAAACGGKSNSQGKGGAGGSSAGTGGASGAGGTSCPAEPPSIGAACTGSRQCDYEDTCHCGVCCITTYGCTNGSIASVGFTDGCHNVFCDAGPPPDGPVGGGGGSGGTGGSAGGSTAGAGGSGGAGGGTSGTGGTMTISACPTSRPTAGTLCSGGFVCNYDDTCRCGACCYSSYRCASGQIEYLGYNDGCMTVTCEAGPTTDGRGPVCTPGADQTCNDNPIWSSIHGHCTDAGTCVCTFDAGTNPDSGHCL